MTTRAPAMLKITLALFLAALLANCIVALARRCCVVCTIRRKLFASLFKTYILGVCSPLCDWKIFTMPQKIFPKKPPKNIFHHPVNFTQDQQSSAQPFRAQLQKCGTSQRCVCRPTPGRALAPTPFKFKYSAFCHGVVCQISLISFIGEDNWLCVCAPAPCIAFAPKPFNFK